MKKLALVLPLFFFSFLLFAQAPPQKMSYNSEQYRKNYFPSSIFIS